MLHLNRRCLAILLALLASLMAANAAEKQVDATDRKIRLMAEALQAQDAGDFATAQLKLESLLVLVPGDLDVQRRMTALKAKMLAAREHAVRQVQTPPEAKEPAAVRAPAPEPRPVEPTPAPREDAPAVAPAEPVVSQPVETASPAAPSPAIPDDGEGLLQWETTRQEGLIERAKAQLLHARKLAQEDRFVDSLNELSSAAALLPLNPLTLPLLREIEALRNDMEHRQRVAGYTQGSPAPRLTVTQVPLGSEAANGSSSESATTVEVHIIEMMPDFYADMLVAWGLIEAKNPIYQRNSPLLVDPRGKPLYMRRESPLPTPRQIRLYWALRGAGIKPGITGARKDTAGMVGLLGHFDPASVVKALTQMLECKLIAAPMVDIRSQHQAVLSLLDNTGESSEPGQTNSPGTSPKTGIEIKVSPLKTPEGMEFAVSPSIVQYEGRLEAGAANTVFSRHEATCRLKLKPGMTAVMGGLVRDSGRVAAGGETGLQRVPFVGNLLRDLATAARQREVVILLTWREPR